MMKIINEIRFKLEIFWIDHPLAVCFWLGVIVGSIIPW
jgi:hypothetical protein